MTKYFFAISRIRNLVGLRGIMDNIYARWIGNTGGIWISPRIWINQSL